MSIVCSACFPPPIAAIIRLVCLVRETPRSTRSQTKQDEVRLTSTAHMGSFEIRVCYSS